MSITGYKIEQSIIDYDMLDLGDHHHVGKVLDGLDPPQDSIAPEHVYTYPFVLI